MIQIVMALIFDQKKRSGLGWGVAVTLARFGVRPSGAAVGRLQARQEEPPSYGTSHQRRSCQVIKVHGDTRLPMTAAGLWVWGQCQGALRQLRRCSCICRRRRQGGRRVADKCDRLRPILASANADATPTRPFVLTPSQLPPRGLPPGLRCLPPRPSKTGQAWGPAGVPPSGRSGCGAPGPAVVRRHPWQIGFLARQTGTPASSHCCDFLPSPRWEGRKTVPSGSGLLRAGVPQDLQVRPRHSSGPRRVAGRQGSRKPRRCLSPDRQGQGVCKSLQDSLSGEGN